MPVTPFHFGPGLLIKSAIPAHFSFLAFISTQVAIDLESGYNLYLDRYPAHNFFHTLPGGLLAATALILVLLTVRRLFPQVHPWHEFSPSAIISGAVIGSTSHSILDALTHSDVRLFGPWGETGHLMGIVSLPVLHLSCTAAGLLGVVVLFLRYARVNATG